jgi:hypothetical protein
LFLPSVLPLFSLSLCVPCTVTFSPLHLSLSPSLGPHLVRTTDPLLVPTNLVTFWLLHHFLRPSFKLTTDPLLVPTTYPISSTLPPLSPIHVILPPLILQSFSSNLSLGLYITSPLVMMSLWTPVEFRRWSFKRHADDSHLSRWMCDRDFPP